MTEKWAPSDEAIFMVAEEIWESFYQTDPDMLWEDFQGENRDRLIRFSKRILEQAKRLEIDH